MDDRRDDLRRSELESQIYYRLFERLSVSERRYRALVEGSRAAVFQCRPDGTLEFVNPAWTELLGYDAEESVGLRFGAIVLPEERGRLDAAMAAHSKDTEEFAFRHKNGASVYAELSITHIPEDGIVGTLHDITGQHLLQQERERARRAIEAADRLKGEFIANVSHEIRTPLSAVVGFASLIAEQGVSAEELPLMAQRIRTNGDQVLRGIEDIVEMSHLLAGRTLVTLESADPRALVAEIGTRFDEKARVRGLRWTYGADATVPARCGLDVGRVGQILTRLVSNALKFTASGEAALTVQRSDDGHALEFVVRDTGPGLTAEQFERVTRPFEQLDNSATRRFGGLGLGLSVASGLAEHLGGRLEVESSPGVGSRFTLRLPLVDAPAPSEEPADDEPATGARVLLVEDTEDMALLTERYLRLLGAEVELARDGAEGLERALAAEALGRCPHVVFMDMQMPVMDGYRATAELRAGGYDGAIVALTAHGLPEDRARCLAAGCDDHLAKPVRTVDLARMLTRYARASVKASPTPSSRE